MNHPEPSIIEKALTREGEGLIDRTDCLQQRDRIQNR